MDRYWAVAQTPGAWASLICAPALSPREAEEASLGFHAPTIAEIVEVLSEGTIGQHKLIFWFLSKFLHRPHTSPWYVLGREITTGERGHPEEDSPPPQFPTPPGDSPGAQNPTPRQGPSPCLV